MFIITDAAKTELQNRLNEAGERRLIRLQMRKSCFMKVKLTLDKAVLPNDEEITLEGMNFIIDKGECHYFNHKTLDFLPDTVGFKEFEII